MKICLGTAQGTGFPTGAENKWGAPQNLMGEGLKSIHGMSMGGGVKMLSKNTCGGVHLIAKLPAISLQACKFTKN